MSRTRGERPTGARLRARWGAEARVKDLSAAVEALKSIRRILQRDDVSEMDVVRLALERAQHDLEWLEVRLERAAVGRIAERRRARR